jgi:hypothetical protein
MATPLIPRLRPGNPAVFWSQPPIRRFKLRSFHFVMGGRGVPNSFWSSAVGMGATAVEDTSHLETTAITMLLLASASETAVFVAPFLQDSSGTRGQKTPKQAARMNTWPCPIMTFTLPPNHDSANGRPRITVTFQDLESPNRAPIAVFLRCYSTALTAPPTAFPVPPLCSVSVFACICRVESSSGCATAWPPA